MRETTRSTTACAVALTLAGMLLMEPQCWGELAYPGPGPGEAVVQAHGHEVCLGNDVIRMVWRVSDGALRPLSIEDKIAGTTLALDGSESFQLVFANTPLPGTHVLRASELRIIGIPELVYVAANDTATRLAERRAGRAIDIRLASTDGTIEVHWRAILRDGSSYIRQVIECQSRGKEVELAEIVVWDLAVPGAEVRGVVDGSPVVAGSLYFAAEDPTTKSDILANTDPTAPPHFTCRYAVNLGIHSSTPRQFRALVGVSPPGQMRRGFLYYLERERAQPYRPFFFGSHVGVWLSPFGGYPCKEFRLAGGLQQGFETYRNGLTLAGPRYYARVHSACTGLIEHFGVNYFKFDGFGAGNNQPGAMDCASDVEALLDLILAIRRKKPDIFINPSTGSWPSPFWLLYCDSIWRQGADTNLQGKGSARQQWTTYRDSQILHGTLARGPLYPVNSLMIHGVFINPLPLQGNPYDPATPRPTYDEREITAEIRSFFATGVNLQELYVAPDLMTARTWDVLAEAD
mgnify:CR=1 FL=1